ncbi:pyridoxal phosphate-dependent aminotransferase [Haliea sp. E1-2-M8]|uniref:pyridoxal phosphate-dependent aminotransferase n=1 Tax=Haliea sp. E1-2-M8 TaxID=3064706 RepID=UPI0027285D23|nr:pyridoxal phosphate-dependent aminotransferase [Haliea sp. E1-2-M8]MDO8861515.1 pyridoxal phosphate-dependent aminotransferase [Haliea sp. E1-2-M8]
MSKRMNAIAKAPFTGRISQLAQRLAGADGGGVWEVHERACEMAARGEPVCLLSIGDPDLPTLPSTIAAAIDSLERGRTHYAPGRGELSLRRTIADIETRSSGKPCDPDEIVIFPGATNAIYSVLACLLDAGEEVVVAEPMYVGYQGLFDALGVRGVSFALDPARGFALDTALVQAAVTAQTRVIMLNTPGNPAGNMIGAGQLRELADWCLARDIWLVCDEVYSMITFEEAHTSLRKAATVLDNIVLVDGLSKSHAMTGWRLGWTVSARPLADRLLDFTSSTIFGCCQFVQDAAAHALTNDEDYIAGVRDEYRRRRDYVCQRVAAIRGLDCEVPAAGMFVMVHVADTGLDGLAFAEALLAQGQVSVLPGVGFGASCRDYVRISLTQSVAAMAPAFDRIETFVATLENELHD